MFPVLWNLCYIHCGLHACPRVLDEGIRGLLTLIVQDKTGFSIHTWHLLHVRRTPGWVHDGQGSVCFPDVSCDQSPAHMGCQGHRQSLINCVLSMKRSVSPWQPVLGIIVRVIVNRRNNQIVIYRIWWIDYFRSSSPILSKLFSPSFKGYETILQAVCMHIICQCAPPQPLHGLYHFTRKSAWTLCHFRLQNVLFNLPQPLPATWRMRELVIWERH